jgi:hypothetical protein
VVRAGERSEAGGGAVVRGGLRWVTSRMDCQRAGAGAYKVFKCTTILLSSSRPANPS